MIREICAIRAIRGACAAFVFAASLVLSLVFVAGARASEDASAMAILVGGDRVSARLQSLEEGDEFHFATELGERTITREELVRWGNPVEVSDGRMVVLAGGSRISAVQWAVGKNVEPLSFENAAITFAPTLLEPVTVPRHLVRGVVLQLPADVHARDRLLNQVDAYAEQEDAVLLVGGDRLTGRLAEIKSDALSIETTLGPVSVPLSNVVAILFDALGSKAADSASRHTLVGLADGSLHAVGEFTRAGDALELRLRGNVVLHGASIEEIVSLQPLGGQVTYLSDIEPHRFVHVPYLDLQWPLGRDRNVLGGRLRAGGQHFSKGLGVHTAARVIYRLDGSHDRFAAHAAIDDAAGHGGSAVFRVLLAEGDKWREVFTSEIIRGGDAPTPISVELGDAKGLALVVDYADRGDELDHADWLDARLE